MKFIALSLLLLASTSFAEVHELPVNLRNSKMKLGVKNIETSELLDPNSFRVHMGMEEAPIDLSNPEISEDLRLRVGTVLYHLKAARNYFVKTLGSEYVSSLPPVNVRLEMSKPFNEFFQFLKDSKQNQYNNAVTIPSSNINARSDINPWNIEIWFRPAKEQEIDNIVFASAKHVDSVDFTEIMTSQVADQGVRDAVIRQATYDSLSGMDYMGYATNLLYMVGAFELGPKILMLASKPFKTTTFLDTAMIPEVVYHEFSHVALSDHISLRRSSPLNEGLANYFAAVINGNEKIASKTGKHAKNVSAYDGNQKMKYDSRFETENAAHANFTFAFLWGLRKRLAQEMKEGDLLADKLVFESRKHIKFAEKSIKDDLIPALIEAASEIAPKSSGRKLRMIVNDEAIKRGI